MRHASIIPIIMLATACEVGPEGGDDSAAEADAGGSWHGSLTLHAERRQRESDARTSINTIEVSEGRIVEFGMQPCYDEDNECFVADVSGLTVTCTHDGTNVYQTSEGEEKVVSTAKVTGDAEAEVIMETEQGEGQYVLAVNFQGPDMPIRVRRYLNGELVEDTSSPSSCSFGHEARRPLPEEGSIRSGKDDVDDPPWYTTMEWHLESG